MALRAPLLRWRSLVVAIPAVWLGLFFLAPLLIVVRLSLSDPASAAPPFRPLFDWGHWESIRAAAAALDLETFGTLVSDPLYRDAIVASLRIAALGTLGALLIGFPLALGIARAPARWRPLLLGLVILPFWTSFLIRVYAWIAILRQEGLLNQALLAIGLVERPLVILNTDTAVLIGLVYAYLPFMVLPIYASLVRIDPVLLEAARDLGAPPVSVFVRIILPLAAPGVLAGCLLVFIPSVGEFVIPDLLGGAETLMIGRLLWTEFFNNRDWPMASGLALVLLALLAVPILILERQQARQMATRP